MISRRYFLRAAGIAGAAAVLGCDRAARRSKAAGERPNMVLIIGDDISVGDHGVYGHPRIRTPNVDRLAAGGLRFTNAYLTSPQCSPTRCSVITGRYPHNTGAPELHMGLPEGQVMFPELLRRSGYHTAAMGKWHLGAYAKRAFDAIADSGPSGAELWVETLRKRPKDRPFFMWFASHDAHREWQADPQGVPHAVEDAVVPPYQVDSEATRRDINKYMDEVQRLDRYVGELMKELEAQGALENTVVIYMADNGRAFPRDKAWLYDGGIRMPLIVQWPAGLGPGGIVSDSLVSAMDIAPTLLELAGAAIPESVQGRSFTALFREPDAKVRDYAFAELNWHTQYSHMRAVRWREYVYIRNASPELSNMMMAKIERKYAPWMELLRVRDEGHLTAAQLNVMRRPRPAEELYDIKADVHQLVNLVDDPAHAGTLRHLQEVMDRWVRQTGDTTPQESLRTPDRYDRETGAIVEGVPMNPPRRDWAGKATSAEHINAPGPVLE